MSDRKVIVIGSSAGSVVALKELVSNLPADFKTPVFIVQHGYANQPNNLAKILDHAGPLHAAYPQDGSEINEGTIYLAPRDHHLIFEDDHILVRKGPKVNRLRPSVDLLFRSAAYCYGPNVTAVILSGMPDEGCSGMWMVKRMGGTAIVQDPDQDSYPGTPASVLKYVDVDHFCPLSKISQLLAELDQNTPVQKANASKQEIKLLKMELDIAALRNVFDKGLINTDEHTYLP
jgi:two-component system chemotaxis response regulator CheB